MFTDAASVSSTLTLTINHDDDDDDGDTCIGTHSTHYCHPNQQAFKSRRVALIPSWDMVKDGQMVVATTSSTAANRDLKGKGRALGPSQTLYTPVFYTPAPPVAGMAQGASPAASSSKPGIIRSTRTKSRSKTGPRRELERVKSQVHLPNLSSANLKRLEELSKRHIALSSSAIPEIPDSQPSSPSPSPSSSNLNPKNASGSKELLDALLAQDLLNGLEPKVALNPHIRRLRTKLSEALHNTSYDPSHGNWATLSTILHLGVTSGGPRWVGARADGPTLDIGLELEKRNGNVVSIGERGKKKRGAFDWCNAETEEEWFEWEKMFEKEMALKRRVEEWTKGIVDGSGPGLGLELSLQQEEEGRGSVVETSEMIERVLDGGEATSAHEEQSNPVAREERAKIAKEKKAVDPLRGANNPLGFSMVKRTTAGATTARALHKGLPRPPPYPHAETSPSKSSTSKGSPSKHRLLGQTLKEKEAKERDERERKERKEKEERKKKNRKELISELSDIMSFPTPSFPESQVVTSTPAPPAARTKGGLPPPPPFPGHTTATTARPTTPAFAGGFPGFTSGFHTDPLGLSSGFSVNAPKSPRTPRGKSVLKSPATNTSRPASPHKPLSSLARPLFPVSPRLVGKQQQKDAAVVKAKEVGEGGKEKGGEKERDEDDVPRTPPPVRRTYGKSPLRASGSFSLSFGSPGAVGSPQLSKKRKLSVDLDQEESGKTSTHKKARVELELPPPAENDNDVVMANTTPRKGSTFSTRAFSFNGEEGLGSVPVFSAVHATSNNHQPSFNDESSSSLIPGLKAGLGEESVRGLPTLTELLASAKKGNKMRGTGKSKRRKSARMGLDVSPVKTPLGVHQPESGTADVGKEKKESGGAEEDDSFFGPMALSPSKSVVEKLQGGVEKEKSGVVPPATTQEAKQTGPTSTQSMLYGPGASRSLRSPETATTNALPTTPRTPKSHSQIRSFLTPRTPKTPSKGTGAASMSMSMSCVSPRTPKGSMSQPVLKTPGVRETPGRTPRGHNASLSLSASASLPPGLGMGSPRPGVGIGSLVGVSERVEEQVQEKEKEGEEEAGPTPEEGEGGEEAPVDPFDISLPPTSLEPNNADFYTNPTNPNVDINGEVHVDLEDIYVPGLDDDYGGLGLAYGYNTNTNNRGAYGVGGVYDDEEGGTTDLESPTKSLSSLAGSDSESEESDSGDDELPQGVFDDEQGVGEGGEMEGFRFEPDVVSTQKEEQMRLVMPPTSSGNPFLDSSLRLPTGRMEPLALLQEYQTQSQSQAQSQSQSQERALGRGRSPNKPLISLQSSQPQPQSQSQSQLQRRKSRTVSPNKSSSQAVYGKYNSQFDVKSRVEEVDRLLERDLELDSSYAGSVGGAGGSVAGDEEEEGDDKLFEGWLKDTSE